MGGSLNKRLLFTSNYYDYEMFCFKREMSAPKRFIDSKAWCLLSFLLELLGIQDKNTKNSIKSKRSKNLMLIDWCVVTKSSVPCSGRKSTSGKMSVDSNQN